MLLLLACSPFTGDSSSLSLASTSISAKFDTEGAQLGKEIRIRSRSIGREEEQRLLNKVAPIEKNGGIQYPLEGVEEWWKEQGGQLEQGWTIPAAPEGEGPLMLYVSVEGAVWRGGELWGEEGTRLWVGDLWAHDARGRELEAEMIKEEGGFFVRVEEEGAAYPLTIDPSYSVVNTWDGEGSSNSFGAAAIGVGDVNGDGFEDVAVGASGYNNSTGRVYIYHGTSTGFSSVASTKLDGEAQNDRFGGTIAAVGDLNKDGYDDVFIGATGHNSKTGRVYAYLGAANGLSSAIVKLDGEATNNGFGISIANAGDVNGDGYPDLVVGAAGYSSNTGRVYLYQKATTGSASATLTGSAAGDYFGRAVGGAGDVNNDGYADIIVGAYGANGGVGAAYLYEGSSKGLSTSAASTLQDSSSADSFGYAATGIGDVNGDGYEDVAVSAIAYNSNTGRVFVHHGSAGGLSTSVATTLTGDASGDTFGSALAGADVDGDGYGDLWVGAPGNNSSTGKVSLFVGSSAGVGSSGVVSLTGDAASNFGNALGAAGDVNGDGVGDVLVGAYSYNSSTGRAYLYEGGSGGGGGGGGGTTDKDGDGYDSTTDCDDTNANINPGAKEVCDSANTDEDCDKLVDDADSSVTGQSNWYYDVDKDGYGDGSRAYPACDQPSGAVSDNTDCNDAEAAIHPGAQEVCDSANTDEDCDGLIDDADSPVANTLTYYPDRDADSYGDPAGGRPACDAQPGTSVNNQDCNDNDPGIHPGATQLCDALDNDCNGAVDDGSSSMAWYEDRDGDGYGNPATAVYGCNGAGGTVNQGGDCNDNDPNYYPGAAESCEDPNDYNCDGSTSYADADQDGYAACKDCNDGDSSIHPSALEVCDQIDNDCNSAIDDNPSDGSVWHPDADQDGYGDANSATVACEQPSGSLSDYSDCNDADGAIYPGAEEKCDEMDNNCDHAVDEGCEDSAAEGSDSGEDSASEAPKNYVGVTGCGCNAGEMPQGWLLLGLLGLRRRR